jgi:thiamine pyrophosphate-dependent acetolactate synthase large subunit-like protein
VVTQLREATPAGAIAVVARALEPATQVWQTVNPGELLVADSVVPSAIGAALQRSDGVVLALTRGASDLLPEDLSAAVEASAHVIVIALDAGVRDIGAAHAAGVRTAVAASPSALALALGAALEVVGPSVIAVPTTGRV